MCFARSIILRTPSSNRCVYVGSTSLSYWAHSASLQKLCAAAAATTDPHFPWRCSERCCFLSRLCAHIDCSCCIMSRRYTNVRLYLYWSYYIRATCISCIYTYICHMLMRCDRKGMWKSYIYVGILSIYVCRALFFYEQVFVSTPERKLKRRRRKKLNGKLCNLFFPFCRSLQRCEYPKKFISCEIYCFSTPSLCIQIYTRVSRILFLCKYVKAVHKNSVDVTCSKVSRTHPISILEQFSL